MAKTMARIEDGIVVNLEWRSDIESEADTLKECGDLPVGIGDTYTDGKFYRDGVEILTPLEESQKQIADMKAALEILEVSSE